MHSDTYGLECLILNVVLSPKMNFNIIVLYNPPKHNVTFYQSFDDLLKALNHRSENIVLGDFNINWLDKNCKQKLKTVISKHKLHQIIKEPTRISKTSKTLIDLIFTNKPDRVSKTYNLLTGLSDHNMILVIRKLTKKRLQRLSFKQNHNYVQTRIPKQKINQFENELKRLNWDNVLQTSDTDRCCDILTNTMADVIQKFTCPFKLKHKQTLPWINNDIYQLMKRRDHALKKITVYKITHR